MIRLLAVRKKHFPNVGCSTGGSWYTPNRGLNGERWAHQPSNHRASFQLCFLLSPAKRSCPAPPPSPPPPLPDHFSPAFPVVSGVYSCPSLQKTKKQVPALDYSFTSASVDWNNSTRHGAAVGSEHSFPCNRSLVHRIILVYAKHLPHNLTKTLPANPHSSDPRATKYPELTKPAKKKSIPDSFGTQQVKITQRAHLPILRFRTASALDVQSTHARLCTE